MEELTLTTPCPAFSRLVSLILLAYTNRFYRMHNWYDSCGTVTWKILRISR